MVWEEEKDDDMNDERLIDTDNDMDNGKKEYEETMSADERTR